MASTLRSRRLALVASVLILGLTACGDPREEPAASGPAVIVVAGAASGTGSSSAPASAESADSKMVAAVIEFLYEGTPPDLTTPAPAWYFPAGLAPTTEQIAAVAAAFGVEGEVRALPGDQGGGFQVGSADYSDDVLTVSSDSMQSWWFSPRGPGTSIGVTCDLYPPGDPMANTDAEPLPECEPAAPPVGVPTAAEAEARAAELLTAVGLDPAAHVYETYADEWGANVTAYRVFDGVRSTVSASFGFGEEGAITWASGYLATPQRAADYPRIGVEAAVARLNEQQAAWMGISSRTETPLPAGEPVEATVAVEPAVEPAVDPAVDPAVEAPETMPTETVAGETTPLASDAPAEPVPVTEPVLVDPMPIETMPLEPITVTLSGGEPTIEQIWAADGTIWLVPGYAFDSTDGGRYTVAAIPDEYLQIQSVTVSTPDTPVPEPTADTAVVVPDTAVVVPDTAVTPPADSGVADSVVAVGAGAAWIGLTVDEATAAATDAGLVLRIVREDGVDLPATMDFRADRLNVAVEAGVVTEIVSPG
jgi:nicotinate-nucleotide--dimethylbenzimidazole phosphoribosyltransferase